MTTSEKVPVPSAVMVLRSVVAVLSVVVVVGCASQSECPEVRRPHPRATIHLGRCDPPVASASAASPSSRACARYDNAAVGQMVIKRAVYVREPVGLTPGQQAEDKAGGGDPYGPMWDCVVDAEHNEKSWCECPRGPSRDFEDTESKNGLVRWVDSLKP